MENHKYHPVRFADSHPFTNIINAYRACNGSSAMTFSEEDVRRSGEIERAGDRWKALNLVIQSTQKPKGLLYEVNWTRNIQLWSMIGAYAVEGKQLFALHPNLAREFLETDIDRLPGEFLRCPYKAMYLYWGTGLGMEIKPGLVLDGTYILDAANGKEIHCYPTAYEEGRDYSEQRLWMMQPDPCWDFRLSKSHSIDMQRLMREAYAELKVWENQTQPGFELFTKWLIDHDQRFFPWLGQCMRLTINALLYLCAYPEDAVSGLDESAPKELALEYSRTPPPKRKRVTQKLVREGYSIVKFVGSTLNYSASPAQTGKGMPTHRRRGHIRLQPVGKGRMERKLTWVRPAWVRADRVDDKGLDDGRIYEVENE